jgi:hypothetical protein
LSRPVHPRKVDIERRLQHPKQMGEWIPVSFCLVADDPVQDI